MKWILLVVALVVVLSLAISLMRRGRTGSAPANPVDRFDDGAKARSAQHPGRFGGGTGPTG